MTRNTVRRVEVAAPIYDEAIKKRIRGMFNIMLSDNVKGRRMKPNGKYCKDEITGEAINSQEYFFEEAYGEHKVEKTSKKTPSTTRSSPPLSCIRPSPISTA